MSTSVTPKTPRRRSRAPLVYLAVLLAAAAATGGYYLWRWYTAPVPPAVDVTGLDLDIAAHIEDACREARKSPNSAAAWAKLGAILFVGEFYDQALPVLARAEQLDPTDYYSPYYRGLILLERRPLEGVECLRRSATLGGRDPVPYLRLADACLENDLLDDAEAAYRRVLDRQPTNSRALLGLGLVAFRKGDLKGSIAYLKQVSDDRYCQETANTTLAQAYFRLGEQDAAAKARSDAMGLPKDPTWPDPIMFRADLLKGGNAILDHVAELEADTKPDELIPMIQEFLRDHSDSTRGWLALGRQQLNKEDGPAAEASFRKALELAPDSVEAQLYLGGALFSQKDYPAAVECFQKILAQKPSVQAYFNLGQSYMRLHQPDKGIEAFENALRINPGLAKAHELLGKLLAERGDDEKALPHLTEANGAKGANAESRKVEEEVRQRLKQKAKKKNAR